jgi:hypothetical protein
VFATPYELGVCLPFSWFKNGVRIAVFTLLTASFYSTPSHAVPPIPVGPAFDYACNKKFWGLSTAYYKTMGFKDRVVDSAIRAPKEVPLFVWSRLREESTDEMVEENRQQARERLHKKDVDRREVWKERAPKISQYMKELGESWGLRVLFKEAKQPAPLALGFLTPWKPKTDRWYHHFQLANPMFWVQLLPRVATKMATGTPHSVSPLRGVFNTAFQVPVRATTGKLLGKAYELTLPLHFLFDGVVYYHVYQVADDIYEDLKKEKLENSVEENGPEYDDMIEYDIRFATIKNDLKNAAKTGITRTQARRAAYVLNRAHNQYLAYLSTQGLQDDPEIRRERRLTFFSLIAPHIVDLIEEGVKPRPGFIFKAKPRDLTNEEVDHLLDIQDEVFVRQRIARAWILDDHGDLAQIEKSPAAAERLADLKQDGFITFLTGLKDNGTLTQKEFLREVQMNIEWQGRFAVSEILQMTPINQNAAEENTPLDITDTQLDTVERLSRQAP